MLSIINRALSWAITSVGNKFNLKKRSRLIKTLDNGFYVKFMQLEIGLFHLGKSYRPIGHEEIGTCPGTEISQDVDNTDQKVKWFLKVHKAYKLLWETCIFFNYLFSQLFIHVHILQIFCFSHPLRP